MAPFESSVQHLVAELGRLDLLLQRELALARAGAAATPEDFRGLVITEGEIEALAQQPDYLGQHWRHHAQVATLVDQLDARAKALREEIDANCRLSHVAGRRLPLVHLAKRAGLEKDELDILLIALAPELEPRYETLYAYVQNDVTRKHPSVDLALNVVSRTAAEKLAARRFLRQDAPLLASRLVSIEEESFDRCPAMLRKFLKVDEDVVAALLDQWSVNDPAAALMDPASQEPPLDVPAATRGELEALIARIAPAAASTAVISFSGDATAAREAAEWVAFRLRRRALAMPVELFERDPARAARLLRSACLGGCLLALTAAPVQPEPAAAERRPLVDTPFPSAVATFGDVVLLLGEESAFPAIPDGVTFWHVEIPPPDFRQRRAQWTRAVGPEIDPVELPRLADSFRFGRRDVARTADLAWRLGALKHPDAPASLDDYLEAGRLLTTPKLQRFARRVRPQATWKDLVLAPEKMEQLRRIARWKRLRHHVHEDWGFARRLTRGMGQCVLFVGGSGTGKTLAAEVVASELGLDMYRIDLSTVVSRYVGDMEGHLSTIFREAEESQCLLFFDEADALFGKRTEMKDAHDRYANIEVDFLLQRLELFDGIVVLATNMRRNMDDAFVRRLNDILEFVEPDERARERIWRGHFPRADLCDADVDVPFLARQFKLTGGSIRNAVLDAAFRAAAEARRIRMLDLLLAIKAELAKHGRLPIRAEFDRYYGLVQPEVARPDLPVGR